LREQTQRLIDFDEKIHGPEFETCVPDQDMLYLQKEISRYNSSIDTQQASRQTTLDGAEKINDLQAEDPDY
jgi:hypothetical protein